MCRIVGVAGTLSSTHKEVFDGLLYLQALNNGDATGLLTVDPKAGETTIMKAAIPSADLISAENYEDVRSLKDVLWLGHNRKATMPPKDLDHLAHPFEEEHVIGVHNGSVRNWKQFARGDKSYEIDSQALIKLINDADNVQEAVRLINGAYALVWYDRRDHTLNMVRNEERPLVYNFTKDRKAFWTCSDPSLFMTARRYTRNNHMELDSERDLMIQTTPGIHYRLHLPDKKGDRFAQGALELTTLDLSRPSGKRSAGGTHRQQEFPSKAFGYHGPKSPWPKTKEKEQSKETTGASQSSESSASASVIELRERKAIAGRQIINDYTEMIKQRFHNDLYMDFILSHTEYEYSQETREKVPKAELDKVEYWRKSMEKLRDETKAKVSEMRKDIFEQGLDPEKAATLCRAKLRLQLAKDVLGLNSGDFWDEYNSAFPPSKSTNSDDYFGDTVDDLFQEDSVSATGADYDLGKSQGESGVPEEILREFDEIAANSHCMCCGQREKHPDIDKTIVVWGEDQTPYGPHETPIGIVCSSCASDPNIRAFAESGAYSRHAGIS